MMTYREIPEYLEKYLPSYRKLIHKWQAEEGDILNYPLISDIVSDLRDRLSRGEDDAENEIRQLFDLTELGLAEGDDSTRDLFVLEVIDMFREPSYRALSVEHLMGPVSGEMFRERDK